MSEQVFSESYVRRIEAELAAALSAYTWYEQLEPEIRDLVQLLRNNGFNTTCSCGHGMYVELDLGNTLTEAEELARFLQEHGYEDFRIEATIFTGTGLWVRRAVLQIGVLTGLASDRLYTKSAIPGKFP